MKMKLIRNVYGCNLFDNKTLIKTQLKIDILEVKFVLKFEIKTDWMSEEIVRAKMKGKIEVQADCVPKIMVRIENL